MGRLCSIIDVKGWLRAYAYPVNWKELDSPTPMAVKLDALVAGGMAGVSVDIALFPLDTMKTRLQSSQGFFKAGGFRGIYNGLGSAAAGSFPNGTNNLLNTFLCA